VAALGALRGSDTGSATDSLRSCGGGWLSPSFLSLRREASLTPIHSPVSRSFVWNRPGNSRATANQTSLFVGSPPISVASSWPALHRWVLPSSHGVEDGTTLVRHGAFPSTFTDRR
jgi:hypothetical protein